MYLNVFHNANEEEEEEEEEVGEEETKQNKHPPIHLV